MRVDSLAPRRPPRRRDLRLREPDRGEPRVEALRQAPAAPGRPVRGQRPARGAAGARKPGEPRPVGLRGARRPGVLRLRARRRRPSPGAAPRGAQPDRRALSPIRKERRLVCPGTTLDDARARSACGCCARAWPRGCCFSRRAGARARVTRPSRPTPRPSSCSRRISAAATSARARRATCWRPTATARSR